MNQNRAYIILLFLLPLVMLKAQISPGDLSEAHAHLEGMSNCTQCHDLGNKVSNTKCLDCHEVIESLMDQNRGYHASREVRIKDCFDCHSEHHGRKFNAVRFDQDNFDHDLTGYELEGQHAVIDCRQCHVPEHISNSQIRKRKDTFLGLDDECLSCHDDYHQGTLASDCTNCHNIEAFAPAAKFDHNDTDYPLKGRHVNVNCIECHEMGTKNGQEFQFFTDIPFKDCIECHEDPHKGNIEGRCTQCHIETSFAAFTGQKGFDHDRRTAFDLKGAHRRLECIECHANDDNPLTVFQDRKNIIEDDCVACHEDVHEGKFGSDCVKCHQEESWLSLRSMDFFDHSLTDYPLEGMHIGLDCNACHEESFLDPIDFSACKNCHEDYHEGEFKRADLSPDCVDCHSLEEGFGFSLYTLEQHQESNFPLEGAHIATPCFACHISEDRWTFRDVGTYCIDCHDNVHEGFISEEFYPDQDCVSCHNNDSWTAVEFDHSLTDWPLEGTHGETNCRACHYRATEEGGTAEVQVFMGLEQDCIACHENIHDDQFAIDGLTDCTRCHDTFTWFPNQFDHNLTAFPLEGAHAEVDCKACHIPQILDGKIVTDFKIEKFECIDCHY